MLEHATIAIEDGRITEVAEARGDAPEGAYDGRGRSVMPALIDCHTHLISDTSRSPGFGPPAPLKGEDPRPRELGYLLLARSCRALLASGVTTIRDVGSNDDEAIVMRRAVELGLIDGPRIVSCGRIVSATSPGGRMFGTMYSEADGPWNLRQAVRAELRRGADFIKVMATGARSVEREDPEPAQLTREELAALVDEAHRLGLRVAAHAEGLDGARLAIEEGVDTIEHGLSLHREPALLDRMAANGQVLVPTLSTFHDLAERFADQWVPRLVDQAQRQLEEAYLTLGAAHAAGVTLAMGFDSGPPGSEPWELVRMAEGGLGPLAALRAATIGRRSSTRARRPRAAGARSSRRSHRARRRSPRRSPPARPPGPDAPRCARRRTDRWTRARPRALQRAGSTARRRRDTATGRATVLLHAGCALRLGARANAWSLPCQPRHRGACRLDERSRARLETQDVTPAPLGLEFVVVG